MNRKNEQNKIPFTYFIDKILFWIYFSITIYEYNFFLILHRGFAFLLISFKCLCMYSIIIHQFTGKYFSNFSNLQKNISPTERFLILDAVLKWYWGVQQSFKGVQHSSS